MIIHTVQTGDTIESIASQYNIPVTRLVLDNNLSPGFTLSLGQAIIIASPAQTYITTVGDTLESITAANNISIFELLRNNPQLSDRYTIQPGEEIVIQYNRRKDIEVLGYSTNFVTEQVLKKTLPYLTYLAILNYRVNALGDISDINDTEIIQLTKQYGVAPIMFLSSMTETGRGSYANTHAIMSNLDVQNQLIENALIMVRTKELAGIVLAFYSIIPEDLPLYVDFVWRITRRLNQEGYLVFVTLTPQTLGYQQGKPYTSSYYADLGRVSNKVILISYQWQQGSIAQTSQTYSGYLKEILDFVVTQIPPEKIYLGQKTGDVATQCRNISFHFVLQHSLFTFIRDNPCINFD